ncbi:class F sortase [Kribbella sp. NPDC050469]|uniref:class F sortase n=1 Tax=Kribbella sp. NPDC050469 TaxID=3364116 RepID=UPI0037B90A07
MAVLVAATLLSPPGCKYLPAVRTHDAAVPSTVAVPSTAAVSVPTRLVVPAAGIDVPVRAVGVAADGQMELPPDPATIGWYRFGPGPGDGRGSMVLGGHLDSKEYGVGPLVRLRKVRPGQLIRISSYGGRTTTYRIDSIREITKRRLPLADLFDRTGPHRLQVVTCGGDYDPDNGGYQQNLVVSATKI